MTNVMGNCGVVRPGHVVVGAVLLWAFMSAPLPAATIGPGSDIVALNPRANSGSVTSLDVFRIPLRLPAGTYDVAQFSYHNATIDASPSTPGSVKPFLAILTDPGEDTFGPTRAYQSIWAGPSATVGNVADVNDIENAANIVDVPYGAGAQRFTLTAETDVYAGIYSLGTGRVAYRSGLSEHTLWRVDHDLEFTPVTGPGQAIAEFSTRMMYRIYGFELEVVPAGSSPNVAGDFNGDGNVDGADFVVWQTNFPSLSGKTRASGDGNGDGAVDGADFVLWQTNFPTTASGSAVAVPEPAAAVGLVWIAVVAACAAMRRHADWVR